MSISNFLLDTNAVSEPSRARPDSGYMDWLRSVDEDRLRYSVLTVAEVRRGALQLPTGRKRQNIEAALAELLDEYEDDILPVDLSVAEAWAKIAAHHRAIGRVVGTADELIAATALVHDLTVVTLNTKHFEHTGCRLHSPWLG